VPCELSRHAVRSIAGPNFVCYQWDGVRSHHLYRSGELPLDSCLENQLSNPEKTYSAYRLRILTGSPWVPLVIVVFSVIRTIIFLTGTIVQVGPFPYLQVHKWKGVMLLVGILAILTDSLLAAALGSALWKRRREFKALRNSLDPTGHRPSSKFLQSGFDKVDELIFFCIGKP
jgi:hypothetical protein